MWVVGGRFSRVWRRTAVAERVALWGRRAKRCTEQALRWLAEQGAPVRDRSEQQAVRKATPGRGAGAEEAILLRAG